MSELDHVDALLTALLHNVGPAGRKKILRAGARDIRKSQAARIARQEDPDGQAYVERKGAAKVKPPRHPMKFMYPKGSASPRLVFMKSWVRRGPLVTGFDREAGAIRSFRHDKIGQHLPLGPTEQTASAPKKQTVRQKQMFKKLRLAKSLKAGATDGEAWVGFSGRAAAIARVHQDGGQDSPSPGQAKVRYARRVLLGLTAPENQRLIDIVMEAVAP